MEANSIRNKGGIGFLLPAPSGVNSKNGLFLWDFNGKDSRTESSDEEISLS